MRMPMLALACAILIRCGGVIPTDTPRQAPTPTLPSPQKSPGIRGHPSEGTCQEKNQIPLSATMISRKDTLQPVQPDGFSEALDAPQPTGRSRSDVLVDPKP
jgi:hypothetical protein